MSRKQLNNDTSKGKRTTLCMKEMQIQKIILKETSQGMQGLKKVRLEMMLKTKPSFRQAFNRSGQNASGPIQEMPTIVNLENEVKSKIGSFQLKK